MTKGGGGCFNFTRKYLKYQYVELCKLGCALVWREQKA